MSFYVYIIQSQADETFYKGFTEQPLVRLRQHNAGEMNYTSKKISWAFVGLLLFSTKREALIAEKKIKKYDHQRLIALLASEKNVLQDYIAGSG